MKMTVTNSFNIDWREYINEDALPTSILTDFYDSLKDDINIYMINMDDSMICLLCANHNKLKTEPGDSPCQWCRYYKWRITC